MTETLDTQSDTMDLINQDHPITTRNELAQAIKDLKTKFKQDNVKPNPVIITNPDEPKKSIRGRPRKTLLTDDQKISIIKKPKKVLLTDANGDEIKGPKGRPKIPDGDKKTTPPQYFVDYYHAKLKGEIACERCGRYVTRGNMCKHKKAYFVNYLQHQHFKLFLFLRLLLKNKKVL